jgi:hypothetical protein
MSGGIRLQLEIIMHDVEWVRSGDKSPCDLIGVNRE